MFQKFVTWLKSKNVTSHTVAVFVIGLSTLLVTDQSVQDFFTSTFQAHPKLITAVLGLAGIIFKYSHSSKPALPPPPNGRTKP